MGRAFDSTIAFESGALEERVRDKLGAPLGPISLEALLDLEHLSTSGPDIGLSVALRPVSGY